MISFQIKRGLENNLPKKIEDGKIYFCTDTGNLFIDYNTERIHINANKAKALIYYDEELEQYVDISANQLMELLQNNRPDLSQADWNQNDATANDYIKNKPFYSTEKEAELIDIVAVSAENELIWDAAPEETGIAAYGLMLPLSMMPSEFFTIGKEYTVVINGTSYNHTVIDTTEMVGAPSVGIGTFDGLAEGDYSNFIYCIMDAFDTVQIVVKGDTPPTEFKVIGIVEDVYKIDPKYLPEGVGYAELVDAGIPEQTIEGFAVMQDPIYAVKNPFPFSLTEGADYTITWDGVKYNVKCVSGHELIKYCGNANYVDMQPGGDIPFAIIDSNGMLFIATESSSPSHTIKIETIVENIHKIDSKYLDSDAVIISIDWVNMTASMTGNQIFKAINNGKRVILDDGTPIYIIWNNGNDAIAYFSSSYPMIPDDATSSEFIEKTSVVDLRYIKPDGSVMLGNLYGNYPLPTEEDANKILVAVGDAYGSTQWIDPSTLQGGGSSSQIQVDWNQTDDTALDYIKNKPEIPEVPTALKNPYALTFSGLVENSYDGSKAINIEIPSDLPEVSEENNGQVLQVVDGVWQPSTPTAVNYTTYIDQSNGYEYYVYVSNGKLIVKPKCIGITVSGTPTYTFGSGLSNLSVSANYSDGSTKEISNYTYSIDTTSETPTITINYTELGDTYIMTTNLIFDDKFIDFTYTINDDNSVTLDTWKGTLNGETSTECVIPEGNNIII